MNSDAAIAEKERLAAVRSYDVLETPAEEDFDHIAQLAADICNTPYAIINFIDEHTQWFKAAVGIQTQSLPRQFSFCNLTLQDDELFEVTNAISDQRFSDYPLVTGPAGVRYYAGVPLINREGYRLGTLCVLSPRHHQLNSYQRIALGILADAIVTRLEVNRRNKEIQQFTEALGNIAAIVVTNSLHIIEYANSLFCNMAGLAPEEVHGRPYNDIKLADPDAEQAAGIAAALENGQLWQGTIRNQNIKGITTWSEYEVRPITNTDGSLYKVLYLRRDITSERLAAERLATTEQLSRSGSWELNVFNRQTAWTAGMFHLFGVPEQEQGHANGQSVMNFVSPADLEAVNAVNKRLLDANTTFKGWIEGTPHEALEDTLFADLLATNAATFAAEYTRHRQPEPWQITVEIQLARGRMPAQVALYPVTEGVDTQGQMLATIISHAGMAETARQLAQYRNQLAHTVPTDNVLLFETDLDGNCTYISARLLRLTGISSSLPHPGLPFVADSDAQHKAHAAFVKQLATTTEQAQHRISATDATGERLWLQTVSTLISDNGIVKGIRHLANDITGQVLAEGIAIAAG
ncbi:MAG: PAS domain-containing protein, partial [Chitinophagia bacterium]|nr:PAS domain-containing protein [Chitinophagia bacterium]